MENGESQEKDKIELVFGNVAEIFTNNDDIDYYFFVINAVVEKLAFNYFLIKLIGQKKLKKRER